MRPTPDHRPTEESGRIIYLGEVRRKKGARRRAPDRQYLASTALIAVLAWMVWLTVLLVVPPARLLTYLSFFFPLLVALSATGALAWYALDWRRGVAPGLSDCVRRGILSGAVVVANLALLAAHRWMIPLAAVTVTVVLVADVAARHLRPT